MVNSKLLYVLVGFLVFLGIISLITGNPSEMQISHNPEAYKQYLLSWSIHGIVAGGFFFLSYLIIRKVRNKSENLFYFIHSKKQYKITGLTSLAIGILLSFFILYPVYILRTPDYENLITTLAGIGVVLFFCSPLLIGGVYFIIKGMTNKKEVKL